ncbi:uncharacterized protein LOC136092645 [Hydra vulgaris]|uniref:uncharacterized protein LOC136092645 n=1 Tax=Hydra vulgaris TaxID=6087 RepID=UPI0032EA7344
MLNNEADAGRVNDVLNDIEYECVKCTLITSSYLQRNYLQQKGKKTVNPLADVAKYGYEKLLAKDLLALEKGVQLYINGTYICIFGAVVMRSGDKLALHQIFGFSSNFNANKSCHCCYTTKEQMQHTFYEKDVDLRTKEHHIADCQVLFSDTEYFKLSGVYKQNLLSELRYFSVPDNICPDSMHDILEGCLQYELKIVLHHLLLIDCLLTIEEFNDRLEIFFLLLGDVVETDNQYFHLIHLLLEICGIIFAPKLANHLITYLTEVISVHHNLFTEIYSGHTFIPKQHFFVHYPTKILQLGPSLSYWCVRFEGKHAPAKEQCHILRNFKNVCKSIAARQQIQLHLDFLNFASIFNLEVGPGLEIMPACLPLPMSVFCESSLYEECFCANFVIKDGVKYMPDFTVVLGLTKICLPRFGKIVYLLICENECTLIVENISTINYDAHIAGYNVCKTSKYKGVKIDNLFDSHVLSLSTGFRKYSEEGFVITRHEYINLDILA